METPVTNAAPVSTESDNLSNALNVFNEDGGEKAPEPPKKVTIDFDKVAETERRLFKERKKWQEKNKQMEARIKELEAIKDAKEKAGKDTDKEEEELSELDKLFDETPLTKEEFLRMKEEEEKKRQETEDQEMTRLENEYQAEKAKKSASAFIEQNAEKYPFLAESKNVDLVLEVIGQQYDKDLEEYGEEYALQKAMNFEQASQITEKYLASQLDSMLNSPKIANYLRQKLGLSSNEESSQSEEPRTLTNEIYENSSAHGELDEEERMRRAVAAIS
jgi:hypothetical protein